MSTFAMVFVKFENLYFALTKNQYSDVNYIGYIFKFQTNLKRSLGVHRDIFLSNISTWF